MGHVNKWYKFGCFLNIKIKNHEEITCTPCYYRFYDRM